MRIWDVPCARLSRSHLLGEHRELHALWNVLRRLEAGETRVGYAAHPETRRWAGHGEALRRRHDEQAAEIARRGWRHASPLEGRLEGSGEWPLVRLPGSVPLYMRED